MARGDMLEKQLVSVSSALTNSTVTGVVANLIH
jgi:hypothetical protein